MANGRDLQAASAKSPALVTANDVARLAGVSQSAVSRAFTPAASIAESTRKRIFAAAKQLGYRPNLIARSLISGRSNLVGVGVGNLRNPFFAESLEAFSQAFDQAGYRLLLFPARGGVEVDSSVSEVLHYRLEALVLLSTALSSTLATECKLARIPVILYNRMTANPEISSVVGDNLTGSRSIAAHLLAGGHQRIAFIAGLEYSSTSHDREQGFYSYMAEQGAPTPIRESGNFSIEGAAAATRRLLTQADRPDAIFCANDLMAFSAINVARHEFGLDVGKDLSIVGFDDVPMASWPAFSLTSFRQPTDLMVQHTVQIIQQLRTNPMTTTHLVVDGELVVRASTRPIRHAADSEASSPRIPE